MFHQDRPRSSPWDVVDLVGARGAHNEEEGANGAAAEDLAGEAE